MPRVGATLAVVPVPTMNGGWAAASRPPYGDKRLKKNTSLRGAKRRGNPRNRAAPAIGGPGKIHGIAPQASPSVTTINERYTCRDTSPEVSAIPGSADGHPGRGVPTEFSFGPFITMTYSLFHKKSPGGTPLRDSNLSCSDSARRPRPSSSKFGRNCYIKK